MARQRLWMRIAVVAIAIATLAGGTASAVPTGTPVPAPPDPASSDPVAVVPDAETEAFRAELAERQAALDALKAQLAELDRELAIATESYNASIIELESTRLELTSTQLALDSATSAYSAQHDLLSDRATEIYRAGELDTIELLLSAKSVTDLVSRIRFLNQLGETDAEIAAKLRAQRDRIAEKAVELEAAEQQAESLEFTLEARRIEVMLRIQERQELLARAEAELLALLDEEADRRQQAEAELLRDILSGANAAGIVVEPGSPVETALAYHGVPYLWAGASPAGFDCSGLVMYVFAQHGISLPHYSGAQFQLGERVAPSALQPGDVVFFGSPVYHVGMYVGGGYFIHAPRTGDFVKLSVLAERSDYAGARRYDWRIRTQPVRGVPTPPPAP